MASTLYPTPTTCPICGKPAKVLPPMSADRDDLDCSGTCGRYAISDYAKDKLADQPLNGREKVLLAAWITSQHREGKERPLISSYVLPAVIGRGG
jgi:hypothetical protein